MIHHPDRGGDAAKFDELRRAYKRALEEASAPQPCGSCGGSGRVKYTRGFYSVELPCSACGGSGRSNRVFTRASKTC